MWDTITKDNNNGHLYGIISSSHRGDEIKPYKRHVYNLIQNNGGMIYTHSEKDEISCLDYLKKIWEIDLNQYYEKGRLIFLRREDFLVDNSIDLIEFNRAIQKGIDLLDKNGAKDKVVCITIDSFWSTYIKEHGKNFYNYFNDLYNVKDTIFLFRYIMEELSDEDVYNLLKNHQLLLVDGVDDFEIYSPEEIVHKSLTLLSRHSSIIHNYEKEMMRVEYLKTLGELMERTVHDMNNLLITILGYAQLSLSIEDQEDINKNLKIIQNTAMDGKNIIDRLQSHIRGSFSSLKTLLEFNSIIETCVEMTKYTLKPNSLSGTNPIEMVVDLKSNRNIYGNEYELRQGIINIIFNGIDAMEGPGTMIIKTYDTGEWTVLEIIDSGRGMDEATINKIFNPYFSTKGDKGTGLGLNIAKKVFENHGGNIVVESKIGVGTRFVIYLPTVESMYSVAEKNTNGYNII